MTLRAHLGSIVIALSAGMGGAILTSLLPTALHARVVTLDAVRLVNAERAFIAKGMKPDQAVTPEDYTLQMLHIGQQIVPTIRDVAGRGAVVVIKQAIVTGDLPDITDAVIARLGLPRNAPSVDLGRFLGITPTTDMLSGAGQAYDRMLREHDAIGDARLHEQRLNDANQSLP